MTTPSQQKIAETLSTDAGRCWRAVYERLAAPLLATAIRPRISVVPFYLAADWEQLDDPTYRAQILAKSPSKKEVATALADNADFRKAVADALGEIGLRPPGRKQLFTELESLLGQRITPQFISQTANDYRVSLVWRPLAELLAVDLFNVYRADDKTAEATLLLHSLLVAFFQSSQLPRAKDVRGRFGEIQRGPLGLRGGLLRIVQRVGDTGILEGEPTYRPYAAFTISPSHQGLSAILDSTVKEAPLVPTGGGSLHRTLPLQGKVDSKEKIPKGLTQADIEIGRTAAWKQYDFSALAFTAIASTEFLLRSVGEMKGLPPQAVGKVARDLKLPKDLKDAVDEVFGARHFNLRNKTMHGAFLEIQSRRTEIIMSLPFAAKIGIPTLNLEGDPFLPDAAAAHALKVLHQVEAWVARNYPLTGNPFAWTGDFVLTVAEEQRARGWLTAAVARWAGLYNQALAFLRDNLPALSVPVQFGLQGWVNPQHSEGLLPQFAFQAIMLEPLARLVYHLAGLPILQHSMTRDGQNQNVFDLKYLMMDDRGYLAPDRLAWLKGNLEAGDAAIVDEVMPLAVKSRDAFAHGAVRTFAEDIRNAYSTPIALAMMLLLTAGIRSVNKPALGP